ncbi:MAG: hypothetical protein ACRD92_06775 [Nitrosopumilaceae archaeon]
MTVEYRKCITKEIDLYQMIYESNLESKLEQILIGITKDNSSPKVKDVIRKFLLYVQHASENFWETFHKSKTYQERLECYYQFTKNQCLATEVLIRDLNSISDEDEIKENLSAMLKEGFTF